jgi:hypothetical protein
MSPHLLTYAIMLPLLALLVWRRVRRQFGLQPIRRRRMITRVLLFAVVCALLALSGFHDAQLVAGLLGGMLLGGGLGLVGIRLTRFEIDPKRGDCYVPNPWLGALLTALLLGRLAWRLLVLWPQLQRGLQLPDAPSGGFGVTPIGYASSTLTMLVIGLLVGYYIVYFSGLLFHHWRLQQAKLRA